MTNKMDENKIYKGHKDYKELMLSEDFRELLRNHDNYAYRIVEGAQCILKGDVTQIDQKGFSNDLYLTVVFDNTVDMLGHKSTIVIVPDELYPSVRLFANTGIEAEVELKGFAQIGYNTCKVLKWVKYNADLMFPHYVCPLCGHDYGFGSDIALCKEHQYCEICTPEDGDNNLIPIHNKEEYMKIKTKKKR